VTADRLILEAGDARLTVSAANGGRFSSLVVDGQELLVTEGFGPIQWGCYPMVPFAGRIRHGRFTFRGRDVVLPINMAPHAIHGTVLDRAWTITAPDSLSIDLGPAWPFPGRVTHGVSMTPDGLVASLTVEADVPMPVSMGWHPWFRRHLTGTMEEPTSTSAPVELDVDAATMLVRDAEGLPTGRTTAPAPRPWDDCFTDLRRPPAVTWPGQLRLELESDATYWVVYDEPVDAICVEPQTAPPDIVNLAPAAGREPPVVEPGQPLTTTMRWRWTRP
jgi:aldose 1-epimerase